ncbi:hypothetical protein GCM10022629_25710 [Amorphoplanes auranticolor]
MPDHDLVTDGDSAAGAPETAPFPPFLLRRSGVYRLAVPVFLPRAPVADPVAGADGEQAAAGPVFPVLGTEELRVDVDGVMPTMTVSGTVTRIFGGRLTWMARVTKNQNVWTGPIIYRDGNTALRPFDNVSVTLTGGLLPLSGHATVVFSTTSGSSVKMHYRYEKAAFREVTFEYDRVSDATAVTSHHPSTHPVRAPGAPATMLTIESAFARVGIKVTGTGDDNVIDISEAGPGATWSDQEMHDAMQRHWSLWADAPRWAVWVLFARLHDQGSTLGGIMFDDIGTAQRQGTAIFGGSFIEQAPAGEANPGPWVERMKFWTAVHEIGHAFNLAHAWQKSLGTAWVPLADEPSSLSYMNYPFRYPGGLDAFFSAFEYGFSPDELLFLRHAPERLVKQGAAPWFSEHGFEQEAFDELRAAVTGPLALDLRVHRDSSFEFLEPVVAELRLKNVSSTPAVVDRNALRDDGLAIVVAKDGGPVRRWLPFARYCQAPAPVVLQPGQAIYGSVLLSAGTGGWLISDPGNYRAFAALDLGGGDAALSVPLRIVVDPPASPGAERLAGEVFTQDVAHTLAFGGSRVLKRANDTLRQLAEELPGSNAAVHAKAVLGTPLASDGKVLTTTPSGQEAVSVQPAAPEEARRLLADALGDYDRAADTIGHIGVKQQTERLAGVMVADDDVAARDALIDESAATLERRGVLPGVVAELRQQS